MQKGDDASGEFSYSPVNKSYSGSDYYSSTFFVGPRQPVSLFFIVLKDAGDSLRRTSEHRSCDEAGLQHALVTRPGSNYWGRTAEGAKAVKRRLRRCAESSGLSLKSADAKAPAFSRVSSVGFPGSFFSACFSERGLQCRSASRLRVYATPRAPAWATIGGLAWPDSFTFSA